ncbi:rRNA maturation RNase YbeY [Lyticum sinuosum]|uniref:rRNA maturation RNase YbeY n=1 Tax=Lyticum sinuosum TaxID=1332059 RepID=UPI00389930E6
MKVVSSVCDFLGINISLSPDSRLNFSLGSNSTIHFLNNKYRFKDNPTNVLAFSYVNFKNPIGIENIYQFIENNNASFTDNSDLEFLSDNIISKKSYISYIFSNSKNIILPNDILGDIIISYEKTIDEANDLKISPIERFSFLVLHGVLHILGYDHINDSDADLMEFVEKTIIKNL